MTIVVYSEHFNNIYDILINDKNAAASDDDDDDVNRDYKRKPFCQRYGRPHSNKIIPKAFQ